MNRRVNNDVDYAWFSLYSHLRSRVEDYTAGDLTGQNMALSSTAHQKTELESAETAANGPDRRAGGIGPKSALEPKCSATKPANDICQRAEHWLEIGGSRTGTFKS